MGDIAGAAAVEGDYESPDAIEAAEHPTRGLLDWVKSQVRVEMTGPQTATVTSARVTDGLAYGCDHPMPPRPAFRRP
jgi:hypothetical protein